MCGIFGTTRAIRPDELDAIGQLLHHRGPDSGGQVQLHQPGNRPPLSLLHTRLAIQDLSANGHQPMQSRDGRWWVTFNGEIYNHFELRQQLTPPFNGTSDTETLVEYLATHGLTHTLAALNGMFAFAAFDSQARELHLVRDHFGIKPLYYHLAQGNLTFASELTPLQQATGLRARLDSASLDRFLSLRYCPSEATLLSGINRLPPGHCLSVALDDGHSHCWRFVEAGQQRFDGTRETAIDEYGRRLKAAVQQQLIADVPVGVLLSGGIDSAIIAAMAREATSDLRSYTVGFGRHHRECELDDAAQTAKTLGIPHHQVTVSPADLLDCLPKIVSAVEEPLGTTSIMPMWYLTQKAKEDVTVVLTGQGNDEPWGGYRRYQIELLLNQIPLLKQPWCRPPEWLVGRFTSDAVQRGLRCLGIGDRAERFRQAYALFSDDEKQRLLPGANGIARDSINYWLDWLPGDAGLSDAERMMRIDTRMNLADDLLLYGDKIAMACALEARVPMLDKELVGFIESLPLAHRTSMRGTKLVHKAMAERYLPREIVHRPKKGFQVPFTEWSRTIWRDFVEANLLSPGLKLYDHLDHQAVAQLWQQHLRAKRDLGRQIFALLSLSLWSEQRL